MRRSNLSSTYIPATLRSTNGTLQWGNAVMVEAAADISTTVCQVAESREASSAKHSYILKIKKILWKTSNFITM